MDVFPEWLGVIGLILACGLGGYFGSRIGMALHLRRCLKNGGFRDHFFNLLRNFSLEEIFEAWERSRK